MENTQRERGIKERISLGIACCRLNNEQFEILLICKRYTYAFNTFVHGRYNSGDNAALIKLFNSMTIDEKIDILSLNFIQMWYRVWLNSAKKTSNYFSSKNKFESTFLADGGARLRKLIDKSSNVGKVWEIPKGHRKNKNESDIHCAVREFYEETRIQKKKYTIFPNTRAYSYIDDNIRYTNIYYIAYTKYGFEPYISFSCQEQIDEICDIRWMNLEDIRHIDVHQRLVKFVRPIFNFLKNRTK